MLTSAQTPAEWIIPATSSMPAWQLQHLEPSSAAPDAAGINITTTDSFPQIEWRNLGIDADACKALYLCLRLPSPAQLVIHYQTADMKAYADRHHWLSACPLLAAENLIFGFDLTSLAGWQGQVHAIRLQFEGLPLGTCLHFGGLAVSNTPQVQLSSPEADSAAPVTFVEVRPPYRSERFVACGRTILAMDEAAPHLGLLTYYDQPLLPTTPVELQRQGHSANSSRVPSCPMARRATPLPKLSTSGLNRDACRSISA